MTESSRLDAARAAQDAQADGPLVWYRSPLALLAGIVLFVGVLALIVLAVSGGDDDEAADDVTVVTDEAAPPISFGGVEIPETDVVLVEGEALPRIGEGEDEAIGMAAPVITATSLANGNPIKLEPGTARVIGFFAHWCPHCQEELPELTTWLAENKLPPNTEFIAVSTAVDSGRGNFPPSDWFTAEGWSTPVLVDDVDGTLLNTFGFAGFPAFVAVDSSGVVIAREGGNIGIDGFERLFANFAS